MRITRKSSLTGKFHTLNLDVTIAQLARFQRGEGLVQDIFPDLPPADREFILTGITQDEWDTLAPPDDEDTAEE